MENWDEVRTAYHVARVGTVSGAAEALGVHHATVIRHIDALEDRLGVKLFQRHARGYTPTESGADLLQVAQTTEDQFAQLVSRIQGQGQGVSGDLIVTSLSIHAPVLSPLLAEFQVAHPQLRIRHLTGERVMRLEYGEAHVAVRAGSAPSEPDNVAQPLTETEVILVASASYIARKGRPDPANYAGHNFVGIDQQDGPAPFNRWIEALAGRDACTYRVSNETNMIHAIRGGAGLGFVGRWDLARDPELIEIESRPDWRARLWLVSHVDLHRTAKVQALLAHLKATKSAWHA